MSKNLKTPKNNNPTQSDNTDALKRVRKSIYRQAALAGVTIVLMVVLLFAMTAGLFILYIYRRTMRKVAANRSFMLSLMLICVITSMMVLTITSNLALSLGMVGALSIVRFRTAVKDPADTAFLFWAVAAGITAGAGFYLLAPSLSHFVAFSALILISAGSVRGL